MTKKRKQITGVVGGLVMVAGVAMILIAGANARAEADDLKERQERLEKVQAEGAAASLTVFPIVLAGQPMKDVADALGLLLEKSGMSNLTTTDAVFQLPKDVEFDEAPVLFGQFVRENPVETEYALYAEYIGAPKTGVDEVRAVLVNRTGAAVWLDRQTPSDADFKRVKPQCPMSCCVLLAKRLHTPFSLSEATADDSGEGKMAKMWAEKSRLPDREERAAIEQRAKAMRNRGPETSLAVYPVLVGGTVDAESGAHLAGLVAEQNLTAATMADERPVFELAGGRNEQRRLWDLARAFRAYVRETPPDADYALYAEYMISPRDGRVMAVHFVVCDRAGEWVIVDFQNDHHADFTSVAPKSHDDCGRLVATRLEEYLTVTE